MSKQERIRELESENGQLKRTLGGAQAANNRLKGENKSLMEAIDRVKVVNGELCAEVNEKDRRIRELEARLRELGEGDVR